MMTRAHCQTSPSASQSCLQIKMLRLLSEIKLAIGLPEELEKLRLSRRTSHDRNLGVLLTSLNASPTARGISIPFLASLKMIRLDTSSATIGPSENGKMHSSFNKCSGTHLPVAMLHTPCFGASGGGLMFSLKAERTAFSMCCSFLLM